MRRGLLLNTIRKDLRRHRRQPLEFLIWLGIPLLVGLLFTLLFGGQEGPRPLPHLLVVDEDDSFLSGLFIQALGSGQGEGFLKSEAVTAAEGRRRLDDGEATALLTLPAGFSDAMLQEKPLALPLVANPSQRILPAMVEEGLHILIDGHFYLHRLIGDDLCQLAAMEGSPTDSVVAAFSVRVHRVMDRLAEALDPPLLALVDEPPPPEAAAADRAPSAAFLFLPSVLFMALLFMAQGLSGEIWEESRGHTLERFLGTPGGATVFLAGKLGTALLLFMAVGGLALAAGAAYLDLELRRLPLALLWAGLAGCGLTVGLTTLQLLCPSQRAASILGMALIFPLMMLGGSFFPFEAMPAWMSALGARTPNGWALIHLKAILLGRESMAALSIGLVVLLASLALLTLINARRLRARFGGK